MSVEEDSEVEGGTSEMKTEDYLQSARDMKFRLDELEKERLDIMSNMISIKSASDYSDRVQSSPRQDALENQVIKITEKLERLNKRLNKERERLIFKRNDIRAKICRMKEGQNRRFLLDYYIECKSWKQIFAEYKYTSIESAYRLKCRAIKDFERNSKKS